MGSAMSTSYTWLEEIRLKRMVVSDECLELIAKSFKNFKVLVLSSCDGFSTDGLAAIASTCRCLKSWSGQEDSYLYELPKKFTLDLLWLFHNTYKETSNATSNGSHVHRLI
ncbi:hypothetical protein Bca52824_035445 [Brassica carinata]|uniref:Uncharacterized protein n=1 Tax=Brassica carinata TaxID=52824 RepID=A0A8X7S0N2_BRACI|nr:hypothetical protein Bca52824_035445 [Brassica carinata]